MSQLRGGGDPSRYSPFRPRLDPRARGFRGAGTNGRDGHTVGEAFGVLRWSSRSGPDFGKFPRLLAVGWVGPHPAPRGGGSLLAVGWLPTNRVGGVGCPWPKAADEDPTRSGESVWKRGVGGFGSATPRSQSVPAGPLSAIYYIRALLWSRGMFGITSGRAVGPKPRGKAGLARRPP